MEQYTRYVGFDVSAETIVIAEARPRASPDDRGGSFPSIVGANSAYFVRALDHFSAGRLLSFLQIVFSLFAESVIGYTALLTSMTLVMYLARTVRPRRQRGVAS